MYSFLDNLANHKLRDKFETDDEPYNKKAWNKSGNFPWLQHGRLALCM